MLKEETPALGQKLLGRESSASGAGAPGAGTSLYFSGGRGKKEIWSLLAYKGKE